jgi:GT2 family glycosyltransferase
MPRPTDARNDVSLPTRTTIDGVAWLCEGVLLVTGEFDEVSGRPTGATLVLDGDRGQVLESRSLVFCRAGDDEPRGFLLTAAVTDPVKAAGGGALVLDTEQAAMYVGADLADVFVDLATLTREALSPLGADVRRETLSFLAATSLEHDVIDPSGLSRGLHVLREALRERLPLGLVRADRPEGLHVDSVLSAADNCFYFKGWLRSPHAAVRRLTAVSPEGTRSELADSLFRFPRPDVAGFYNAESRDHDDDLGFIAHCVVPVPSLLDLPWIFELETESGVELEIETPAPQRDERVVRDAIILDQAHERPNEHVLRATHIAPAISRLQARLVESVDTASVHQFGEPFDNPDVTIIVPLYKRTDFLEHQLAQFVHDPEIFKADLIYVLDSPELGDELVEASLRAWRLYNVPFRVARLNQNAGFSMANNEAAKLRRGRLLLLLNSDVLPKQPGWLGSMVRFHDANPRMGALGVKLLYEDESLQHAGLYFDREPGSDVWNNEHFFKGLHSSLAAANVARTVPSVTAACLMIEGDLFDKLGGFKGTYVQGDFEDSDLCLRLVEAGREIWYLPDVELYHLEGQSYPSLTRRYNSEFNKWLHSEQWAELIARVSAHHAAGG